MAQADGSALVDRVRELVAAEGTVREVSMFGGRAFMVDDAMVVSVQRNGDLLVRVPAEQHEELLTRPGAGPAEMGAGRIMGSGWISVSAAALTTEEDLAGWLRIALERNRRH